MRKVLDFYSAQGKTLRARLRNQCPRDVSAFSSTLPMSQMCCFPRTSWRNGAFYQSVGWNQTSDRHVTIDDWKFSSVGHSTVNRRIVDDWLVLFFVFRPANVCRRCRILISATSSNGSISLFELDLIAKKFIFVSWTIKNNCCSTVERATLQPG